MKFSELIDHAVECIKTFNPVIKTIDSHADSYLEKVRDDSCTSIGKDNWVDVFTVPAASNVLVKSLT